MHLSLLSDSFVSDSLDDGGLFFDDKVPTAGQAHRDGLLRGLAVLGVIGLLTGLACLSSALHADEADPSRPAADAIHCAVAGR